MDIYRMATLDFNMTEQELAEALVSAALTKSPIEEEEIKKSNPLSDNDIIGDNSHLQQDNVNDTQAKSAVPVG